MKINEKQFNMSIAVLSRSVSRQILFLLYADNAMTYTEIKEAITKYKEWGETDRGKFAYYLRILREGNLIKKEREYYCLTRIGLQITKLVNDVQKICMDYDLSDCDADGKIEVMVRRK